MTTLYEFAGANIVTINELNCKLEDYKSRVIGLEQQMQQHKQEMEHEFQVRVEDKDKFHKDEMENIRQEYVCEIEELKTKEQENDQFLEQESHMVSWIEEEIKELLLEGSKEESKFLKLFKDEAIEGNEQRKEAKRNFFMELKDVQVHNKFFLKSQLINWGILKVSMMIWSMHLKS